MDGINVVLGLIMIGIGLVGVVKMYRTYEAVEISLFNCILTIWVLMMGLFLIWNQGIIVLALLVGGAIILVGVAVSGQVIKKPDNLIK